MAEERKQSWTDWYDVATKGPACLSSLASTSKFKKCLALPDNASDKDRVACQRLFQTTFETCTQAHEAYEGTGGKGAKSPPTPPK